jgi:hypothetical protein
MAHIVKAIQAYSPRVKIDRMVEVKELAKQISGRTGVNIGTLHQVLYELHENLLHIMRAGCSVRFPGLGSFAPTIDKNGNFRINHRPDKELIDKLNASGLFVGKVRNKDMIGKSTDEFIKRWNDEHPEDKIKL